MIVAALLTAWTTVPDAVTIEIEGTTVARAVAHIGDHVGQNLSVSQNIANDLVFMRVKGVSLEDLKSRLAQAANATWIETPVGLRLERSRSVEAQLRAASVDRRAERLSEFWSLLKGDLGERLDSQAMLKMARDVTELASRPSYRGHSVELDKLIKSTPSSRFLIEAASSIDPSSIVELPYGERRLYAFRPTALQNRMPDGLMQAFEEFTQDQALMRGIGATFDPPPKLGSHHNPFRSESVSISSLNRTLIQVEQHSPNGGVLFSLESIDDRGQLANLARFSVPAREAVARSSVPGPSANLTPIVRFILSSQAQVQLQSGTTDVKELEKLYDPHVCDAEGLIMDAALRHAFPDGQVVAVMGDSQVERLGNRLAAGASGKAIEQEITGHIECRVVHSGGWIVISPLDPYIVSRFQTSRDEMRRLLQESRRDGHISTRSLARFTSRLVVPSHALRLLAETLNLSGRTSDPDWHTLRFLGTLSSTQWSVLEGGRALELVSFNAEQRQMLKSMVMSKSVRHKTPDPGGDNRLVEVTGEPSVVLGRGIPVGTRVSLVQSSETSIMAHFANEYRTAGYAVAPAMVAGFEDGLYVEGPYRRVGYSVGTKRIVRLRVDFGADVWQTAEIQESIAEPGAKPVPWTELPPKFVDQIKVWRRGG